MIMSLQLEEQNYGLGSSFMTFDLVNKNIIYIKNNVIVDQKPLNINVEQFRNVLNNYIAYWDNNYVDNKFIDGKSATLKIYTDAEVIEYNFKNKFPHNYNEFLQFIKKEVGIYE